MLMNGEGLGTASYIKPLIETGAATCCCPSEGRGPLVDQWACDLYAGSDQTKPFKSSGNTY